MKLRGADRVREMLSQLEEAVPAALAAEAAGLAEAVRAGLGQAPGGSHDRPWQRSGALAVSVGFVADGSSAVVGSSDPAAVPQEVGTATVPPRPFLAPVAAEQGEAVMRGVAARVAAVLRG